MNECMAPRAQDSKIRIPLITKSIIGEVVNVNIANREEHETVASAAYNATPHPSCIS